MTTTEIETNFNKFAAAETARHVGFAAGEPGRGEDHYRAGIVVCNEADEMLTALRKRLAELNDKSDAAVQRHTEVTAPLQAELSDSATPPDRRIECRMAVNAANAELQAVIKEITPQIDAVKDEIEIFRGVAGRRLAIENAYFVSNPEDQMRVRILRAALNPLNIISDQWDGKAADATTALAAEKDRRQRNQKKYDLAELEKNAAIAEGVAKILGSCISGPRQEIDRIRADRVAKLYEQK